MDLSHSLQRFVDAQEPVYRQVVEELTAGSKATHWMWFVFPQPAGLGRSTMAIKYAIASKEEAQAYWQHDVLGPRLKECVELVLADDPEFKRNENFRRDMFNVPVSIVAQTCLVAAPIFLVIRENVSLASTLVVFGVCSMILKKTWFDHLEGAPVNA